MEQTIQFNSILNFLGISHWIKLQFSQYSKKNTILKLDPLKKTLEGIELVQDDMKFTSTPKQHGNNIVHSITKAHSYILPPKNITILENIQYTWLHTFGFWLQ